MTTDTVSVAYTEIFAEASNPRQRVSLERIKIACDYLETNGLKLSPKAIERYCVDRAWEGPKAQSIRNSKDILHKYLKLRQAAQSWAQTEKRRPTSPLIADQSIRSYVQLLTEERNQAVAARLRIEAGLRKIPGIRVDDLIRGDSNTPLQSNKPSALPAGFLNVARTLLDERNLLQCSLELYKGRVRCLITKNVLLEKSHVDTLRATIDNSDAI
jgi:hypothetical protein